MKKILLTLIIGMFLLSFTSAAIPNLEDAFKSGSCLDLPQTCADCTYNNISKITVDTITVLGEVVMTKDGTNYNYTFCNTTLIGDYVVHGYGDLGGTKSTWDYGFKVTLSGKSAPSSGESILYFVFVTVLFGVLLIMIYFIYALPSGNYKENEVVVAIAGLKYLRIFLIAISYPLVIIILNLLNGLAVNFVSLTIFAGIIGFLFEILLRGAWVFTIIIILWIFYLLIRDSNFRRMLKKIGRPLQ